MLTDRYDIIITPQKTSRVFRIRIPGLAIKLMIVFFAGFLATTAWIGYSHYAMTTEKKEYYDLLNKHRRLQISFRSLTDDLTRLNAQIKEKEDLDKKIRIVTYQQSGLADLDIDDLSRVDSSGIINEKLSGESLQIVQQLYKLKYDLSLRKISFLQIISSIHENKDRLSRTPTIRPVRLGYLTSSFGVRNDPFTGSKKMHYGIDWAFLPLTPIYATANGKVEYAKKSHSYGNLLTINHGYDVKTRYAHLAKFDVKPGDKVKRGDVIGRMGNTGIRSTATHLHYEVKVRGSFVNPSLYILEPLIPQSEF